MSKNIRFKKPFIGFVIASIFSLLFIINHYNSLLFHILVEICSLVIVLLYAIFAINSRNMNDLFGMNRTEFNFIQRYGIASFFSATLDFIHNITFTGLQILPFYTLNSSYQFLIGARILQALSLFIAVTWSVS